MISAACLYIFIKEAVRKTDDDLDLVRIIDRSFSQRHEHAEKRPDFTDI
ncbi:hypothetical protein EMIT074MI3_10539 [Bacillus licheniformis]